MSKVLKAKTVTLTCTVVADRLKGIWLDVINLDNVALAIITPDTDLDVWYLGSCTFPAGHTNIHPELKLVLVLESTFVGLHRHHTLHITTQSSCQPWLQFHY